MGQINAPYGANAKKTIVGRGASSKGRACGRGHDGQNSRSGGGVRLGCVRSAVEARHPSQSGLQNRHPAYGSGTV